MAISMGGIFSKQAGKVSGVVFQKARTRYGKKSAVRELVIPANPRSYMQTINRMLHAQVTEAVKQIGRENYRTEWNNAVRGLAGYQSLIHLLKRGYDVMEHSTGPPYYRQIPYNDFKELGDLHFPEEVSSSPPGRMEMIVNWSTETGETGSGTDRAVVVLLPFAISPVEEPRAFITVNTSAVRSDGQATLYTFWNALASSGRATILLYFVSDRPKPHNVSRAVWYPSELP